MAGILKYFQIQTLFGGGLKSDSDQLLKTVSRVTSVSITKQKKLIQSSGEESKHYTEKNPAAAK